MNRKWEFNLWWNTSLLLCVVSCHCCIVWHIIIIIIIISSSANCYVAFYSRSFWSTQTLSWCLKHLVHIWTARCPCVSSTSENAKNFTYKALFTPLTDDSLLLPGGYSSILLFMFLWTLSQNCEIQWNIWRANRTGGGLVFEPRLRHREDIFDSFGTRPGWGLLFKLPPPHLNSSPPTIGMSGTLRRSVIWLFVLQVTCKHEEIMHTCNIFYFHMRFKCFLYSQTSFFLPCMRCKRQEGKKCFS